MLQPSEIKIQEMNITQYEENLRELKGSIVISLLSLIEGRSDSLIHDRLVQELNFDAMKDNLIEVYKYFIQTYQVRTTVPLKIVFCAFYWILFSILDMK